MRAEIIADIRVELGHETSLIVTALRTAIQRQSVAGIFEKVFERLRPSRRQEAESAHYGE